MPKVERFEILGLVRRFAPAFCKLSGFLHYDISFTSKELIEPGKVMSGFNEPWNSRACGCCESLKSNFINNEFYKMFKFRILKRFYTKIEILFATQKSRLLEAIECAFEAFCGMNFACSLTQTLREKV
jgi:hypothetical protein